MKTILKVCFLFVFLACGSNDDTGSDPNMDIPPVDTSLYFPPVDTDEWETISPDELNWNSNAISDLLTFVEETNAESFIVLKNGRIAIEWYGNGANASSNHTWNSASKTIASMTLGIAQEEGLLEIYDTSNQYLGEGWTSMTLEQENNITIWNHLTMTTGIDFEQNNSYNTGPEYQFYLNEPGTFWYYDNATYTLTHRIVEGATGIAFKDYFYEKIRDKIGMQGIWFTLGDFELYTSNARSMARYGLLCLNKGVWESEEIVSEAFFDEMTTTSQNLNEAYGYFWWLNGKSSFKLPSTPLDFTGELIPTAPSDLIAALGKDDQKIYILPSENLVIVRMGDNAGDSLLGPSSYDSQLWEKIRAVYE